VKEKEDPVVIGEETGFLFDLPESQHLKELRQLFLPEQGSSAQAVQGPEQFDALSWLGEPVRKLAIYLFVKQAVEKGVGDIGVPRIKVERRCERENEPKDLRFNGCCVRLLFCHRLKVSSNAYPSLISVEISVVIKFVIEDPRQRENTGNTAFIHDLERLFIIQRIIFSLCSLHKSFSMRITKQLIPATRR
jgi:hypothetical protein